MSKWVRVVVFLNILALWLTGYLSRMDPTSCWMSAEDKQILIINEWTFWQSWTRSSRLGENSSAVNFFGCCQKQKLTQKMRLYQLKLKKRCVTGPTTVLKGYTEFTLRLHELTLKLQKHNAQTRISTIILTSPPSVLENLLFHATIINWSLTQLDVFICVFKLTTVWLKQLFD